MFAKRMDEILRPLQWPIATLTLALSPVFIAETLRWILRTGDYPVYATMFWLGFALIYLLFRSQRPSHEWLLKWISRERQLSRTIVNVILFRGGGQAFSLLKNWLLNKFSPNRALKPSNNESNHPSVPSDRATFDRDDRLAFDPHSNSSDPRENNGSATTENWLTLCAPFFLPSAPMLLWLASALILPAFIRCLVLGAGLAYHLLSVYVELRSASLSRLKLDPRLIWSFILPMNIVVFGITYAFALKGFTGITSYLFALGQPIKTLGYSIHQLRSLLGWSEST